MARVSPGLSRKFAPLTALATPSWVRNSTCRSLISSSWARGSSPGSTSICALISVTGSPQLRVEGVADRVAEHDEGQHGGGQEHRRPDQWRRRGPDETARVGNGDAPADGVALQPDAEERERG